MIFNKKTLQNRLGTICTEYIMSLKRQFACPSEKGFFLLIVHFVKELWRASSSTVSELQHGLHSTLFTSLVEFHTFSSKALHQVRSTILGYDISRHVLLPVVAAVASILHARDYCTTSKIQLAFLQFALFLSVTTSLEAGATFLTHKPHFGKEFPDILGCLFLCVTYRPFWDSILLSLVLHSSIQSYLLGSLDTLKKNPSWATFLFLFWWKAVKIIVNTFSYVFLTKRNLYRVKTSPTFSPKDVTVVVPSVGEFNTEFEACITSILRNSPGQIIFTTAGTSKLRQARGVCEKLEKNTPIYERRIIVTATSNANKRSQFIWGVNKVETPITAYADDHVFWPKNFLKQTLAPFEDSVVGLVGTVKRVRRVKTGTFVERLLNYIAVIYLERHNFECTATNNIDGGVFVMSGRTALARTEILQRADFKHGHLNETWWWGQVGPMKVDDDNFITRYMVNNGYKTVFHNEPDALLETTLGTEGGLEKFSGQLLRWVRTTWRSNSTSLFSERKIWRVHPWTALAMMVSLFFNISLLYDTLLFLTLNKSGYFTQYWPGLVMFLVGSKTVKQVPHLLRNPDDIWPFWILGMLFGYVHSIYKIRALFTAGNIEWCGRTGIDPVGRPQIERSLTSDDLVSRRSWVSSLPLRRIWGHKDGT